jgi:hypothetical protein
LSTTGRCFSKRIGKVREGTGWTANRRGDPEADRQGSRSSGPLRNLGSQDAHQKLSYRRWTCFLFRTKRSEFPWTLAQSGPPPLCRQTGATRQPPSRHSRQQQLMWNNGGIGSVFCPLKPASPDTQQQVFPHSPKVLPE